MATVLLNHMHKVYSYTIPFNLQTFGHRINTVLNAIRTKYLTSNILLDLKFIQALNVCVIFSFVLVL